MIALSGQFGGVEDNQGKSPLLLIDLMSLLRQGEISIIISVFTAADGGRADQVCTKDNSTIDSLDEICPCNTSNLP